LNTKRLAATLFVTLACAATQVQSAAPAAAPTLPVLVALKAAEAALKSCTDQGLTPTVTISDREGVARVVLVADGAGPVSISTSRRKAYSAASLGISTAQLAKNAAEMHIIPQSVDPELLPLPGGFPIVSHNVVVGGIGVGGADRGTSSADESCAQAGLDSIKSQLD
jgi:glc operon protein GlcG